MNIFFFFFFFLGGGGGGQAVFDPYRGTYGIGYIFCTRWRPLPWIISVNKFRFFTNILNTLQPTNVCNISLERNLLRAPTHFCCIKIHAEMA